MEQAPPLESSKYRLAAVAGTSTCHLVQVSLIRALRRSLPDGSDWLNLGASDAGPIVCPRGMGSLQGTHGPLVEARAANVQAFDIVSLPHAERAVS